MIEHKDPAKAQVSSTGPDTTVDNEQIVSAYEEVFSEFLAPLRFEVPEDDRTPAGLEMVKSGPLALANTYSGQFVARIDLEDAVKARPGLMLSSTIKGRYESEQDGRVRTLEVGDVCLFHTQDRMKIMSPSAHRTRLIFLPDTMLTPLIGDIGNLAGRPLERGRPESAMLAHYLAMLDIDMLSGEPQLGATVGRQVADILAAGLASEARREDPTEGRGMKSVRLVAVKKCIERNIANPLLNAERVGRSLSVSGRYVQKLMEEDGSSFSAYLMEKRLQLALTLLADGAFAMETVAAISERSGFSDPAHFSRSFRRRFGETPGAFRKGA